MKSVLGVLVVVGVAGALGAGAAGASGAGATSCTAGFTESRTASELTVSGDTCAMARKVAQRAVAIPPKGCLKVLDHKGHLGFRRPCAVLSYTCRAVTTNKRRALKVTCTRGSRQIRFRY
jgi:hypothetical protein